MVNKSISGYTSNRMQNPTIKLIDSNWHSRLLRLRNSQFTPLNKKFWKELIAFFSLAPHRKRHLQQFFFAAGTCLPSRCLATARGYTHTHTHTHTESQILLSQDMGHTENDASNKSSVFVCILYSGRYWCRQLEVERGARVHIYTDTATDLICLHIFSQNKESRLNNFASTTLFCQNRPKILRSSGASMDMATCRNTVGSRYNTDSGTPQFLTCPKIHLHLIYEIKYIRNILVRL
jgi:hypothetical protein